MDEQKRRAALGSLEYLRSGMTLGLGTGSTAAVMIELLGERVRAGFEVRGVATSEVTGQLAARHGVPVISLAQAGQLDLTIDGADEVDGELFLIKGGGGALLREKIVASLSRQVIVIVDASKRVDRLGRFPLPVEVVPFAAQALVPRLAAFGCVTRLRGVGNGDPFLTDEGNHIVDCSFASIADPRALAQALNAMPGVVEHGLFIDMADRVIVGTADGVEELRRG